MPRTVGRISIDAPNDSARHLVDGFASLRPRLDVVSARIDLLDRPAFGGAGPSARQHPGRQQRVVLHVSFTRRIARGVYLPPSSYEVCFLSLAHDEATLTRAADALVAAAREADAP